MSFAMNTAPRPAALRARLFAAVALAASAASPAVAAPTYLRQTRYVTADLPAPGQADRRQTGDEEFNDFDARAAISYRNPYGPPYDDGGAAAAVQRSVLSPGGIAFTGTVRAESLASTDEAQSSTGFGGQARSYLQVVFDLVAEHAFTLAADTDGGTGDPAKMCWTLERLEVISPELIGLTSIEDSGFAGGAAQSTQSSGTLSPGTYRLTTVAMAETKYDASSLGYHVSLDLSESESPAPPAMIPLPSGLASGLATLAAAGALATRRRVAR